MIEAARLGAVPQIMVFDCLQFNGEDIRGTPYLQRTDIYLDALEKNAIVAPALRKLVRKPSEVEEAFNFMLKFDFEVQKQVGSLNPSVDSPLPCIYQVIPASLIFLFFPLLLHPKK